MYSWNMGFNLFAEACPQRSGLQEALKKQESWLDVLEREDDSEFASVDGSKTSAPRAVKMQCCALAPKAEVLFMLPCFCA